MSKNSSLVAAEPSAIQTITLRDGVVDNTSSNEQATTTAPDEAATSAPVEQDPLPETSLSAAQLLENIRAHLASASVTPTADPDIPANAPAEAHDHIKAVHCTLNYLLDTHTQFPSDPTDLFLELMDLYADSRTYALVAAALNAELPSVTPSLVHGFFARIAWLNEASIQTPTAREQLAALLNGTCLLSQEATRLGQDEWSELGTLLAGVPHSLQVWMLQFKRGQHRDTASDWLTQCPAENLLQSLTAYQLDTSQTALSTLATQMETLLPTTAEYEDQALVHSRNLHLTGPMMKLRVRVLPVMSQVPTWANDDRSHDDLPSIDWSDAQTRELGAQILQKVTLHTLNAETQAWVRLAIDDAQRAPGMQAYSFATELQRRHPTLSKSSCLRLASLLLPTTASAQTPSPLAPLPDSRPLEAELPAFNDWCPEASIDDFLSKAGFELLCETQGGARHLRVPAAQAWQLAMCSSQFAELLQPLLEKLGWYGALPDEHASPRVTQALASRTIVDHFLGPRTPDDRSMAQDFQDHWVTEHSHLQLRAKINDDIRARNPDASPAARSLLEYLLLREIAPELLISNTPDWLYYGRSLQSVALIHGARLLEAMLPGASSRAAYDKVITLASDVSGSDDEQLQSHWSNALILPALRYAKAHGALPDFTGNDISQASLQQINQAVQFVTREQQAFAQDAQQIAKTPPDRKTLAEQQLSEAGVEKRYWDKSIAEMRTWKHLSGLGLVKSSSYPWHQIITAPTLTSDIGDPSQKPIIENLTQLMMSGDIYRDGKSTVPQLYDQAFDAFKIEWEAAHARLIKRLFMELPQTLRNQLYTSTCEVSQVAFRGDTGTQALFIRCQSGDHRDDFDNHEAGVEHYFELCPGAGALRPCKQFFKYNIPSNVIPNNPIAQQMIQAANNAFKRKSRLIPQTRMDSDAYLNGSPSRVASQLQTPRNGTLIPSTQWVYANQASEEDFFQTLATTATTHLYTSTLDKLKADHTHTTPWEKLINLEKQIADFLARALLPFYGCIADLVKGDHSAGVIIGCVMDAVGVLIPVGKFMASSLTLVRNAGKLTLRAACEVMSSSVRNLLTSLAEQSPVLIYRDIGRGIRWLSVKSWEKLAQPALHWLQDLRGAPQLLHMTEEGTYAITREALSELGHSTLPGELEQVGTRENTLVRNLGTPETPNFKLLDPLDNLPFGPRLIEEDTSLAHSLNPLKEPGSISPDHYPTRIATVATADERLSMSIDEACEVRVRYKGEGHYDIHIDDHGYHLDTTSAEPCLTELPKAPISELTDMEAEQILCRLRRDVVEVSCTPHTKLVTLPAERLGAPGADPLTRGQEISQAFEAREFHLERRTIPASEQSPEQTHNLLVHEGKFCKWDYAPIKRTNPVRFTPDKQIVALSAEQRDALGLPEVPNYRAEITGRMSSERNFGFSDQISGTQAKTINPQVPVVELEQICDQVTDRRRLRGISMEWEKETYIYVEVDNGQFYKTSQGPGELSFTPVSGPAEIDEYLRLSNQYRFVSERPYSAVDRDNIAQLLYHALVEKDEPGLKAWLASAPSNREYQTYAQWCIDNNVRNDMLHFAENILSGEHSQSALVEETRALIPDWRKITQRNIAEKRATVETLNELLPIKGKEATWVPVTVDNIVDDAVSKMISKQVNTSNLAFFSIQTKTGDKFVYYALAGGKRAEKLNVKIHVAGETSRTIEGITYTDARELMKDRAPDPSITSLPNVRHAGRLNITGHSRHLDAERLIASIVKEQHPANSIDSIHVFTRMDTCRSCGGVVLPQLALAYNDADFWVTYLDDYQ